MISRQAAPASSEHRDTLTQTLAARMFALILVRLSSSSSSSSSSKITPTMRRSARQLEMRVLRAKSRQQRSAVQFGMLNTACALHLACYTADEWVRHVYQCVLGRSPDIDGAHTTLRAYRMGAACMAQRVAGMIRDVTAGRNDEILPIELLECF